MRRFLFLSLGLSTLALATVFVVSKDTDPAHAQSANPDVNVTATHYITQFDKVPRCAKLNPNATIVTNVASGNWSSAATWGGTVPGNNAVVQISNGTRVLYDVTSANARELNCVEVLAGATLEFAAQSATHMKLHDGLLVYPTITYSNGTVTQGGTLIIGTQNNPVSASAHIEFLDSALKTNEDPQQFSKSLIGLGNVTIHGTPKTTYMRASGDIAQGATSVTFERPVVGWNVGDTVHFPETAAQPGNRFNRPDSTRRDAGYRGRKTSTENEHRAITGVSSDGRTITLNQALTYAHPCARDRNNNIPRRSWDNDPICAVVGNLTRTVKISSENPTGTRGHSMFLHRANVDIRYAEFEDLGRTTDAPLDSTTFNTDGSVLHLGANQIGRYFLHAHHLFGQENGTTGNPSGYQFQIIGNAVYSLTSTSQNGTKWGIAIHDSHFGLVEDNVVVRTTGAGLVAEDGTEWKNKFRGNFVSHILGDGLVVGSGPQQQKPSPGSEGTGIWLAHNGNLIEDNIVQGVAAVGIHPVADLALGTINKSPLYPGTNAKSPNAVLNRDYFVPVFNFSSQHHQPFRRNEVGATAGVYDATGIRFWKMFIPGGFRTENIVLWHNFQSALVTTAIDQAHDMRNFWVYVGYDPVNAGPSAGYAGFGPVMGNGYMHDLVMKDFVVDRAYIGIYTCGKARTIDNPDIAAYHYAIGGLVCSESFPGSTQREYLHIRNPRFTAMPGYPLKTITFSSYSNVNRDAGPYPIGFRRGVNDVVPISQTTTNPSIRVNVYNWQGNPGEDYEFVSKEVDPSAVHPRCGGTGTYFEECIKKRISVMGFGTVRCMENESTLSCDAPRALGQQLNSDALVFQHSAPLIDWPTPTGTDKIMPNPGLLDLGVIKFPTHNGYVNANNAKLFVRKIGNDTTAVKDMRLRLDNQSEVTLPLNATFHDFGSISPGPHTATLYLRRPDDSQIPYSVVTISFTAYTPDQNPVVHLKFDETQGTAAADSSGNNNNGTLVGGAQWSSDTPFPTGGGSLYFDGVNGYVTVKQSPSMNAADLTVSAWVKSRTTKPGCVASRLQPTILLPNTTMLSGYMLCLGYSNVVQNAISKIATWLGFSYSIGQFTVNDGGWHHIAMVTRGNDFEQYFDGTLDGSAIADRANPTFASTREPLFIGVRRNHYNIRQDYLSGNVDDVRVYNRALSQAEIQALVAAGGNQSPPQPPPQYLVQFPVPGSTVSSPVTVTLFPLNGDPANVAYAKLSLDNNQVVLYDQNGDLNETFTNVAPGSHSLDVVPVTANQQPIGTPTRVTFRVGNAAATTGGTTGTTGGTTTGTTGGTTTGTTGGTTTGTTGGTTTGTTGGMTTGGTTGGATTGTTGGTTGGTTPLRIGFINPKTGSNQPSPIAVTAAIEGAGSVPAGAVISYALSNNGGAGTVPAVKGLNRFTISIANPGTYTLAGYVRHNNQSISTTASVSFQVTAGAASSSSSSAPPRPASAVLCINNTSRAGYTLTGTPQSASPDLFTLTVKAGNQVLGTSTALWATGNTVTFSGNASLLDAIWAKQQTPNTSFSLEVKTPGHFTNTYATTAPLSVTGQCTAGSPSSPGDFNGDGALSGISELLLMKTFFIPTNLTSVVAKTMFGTITSYGLGEFWHSVQVWNRHSF